MVYKKKWNLNTRLHIEVIKDLRKELQGLGCLWNMF